MRVPPCERAPTRGVTVKWSRTGARPVATCSPRTMRSHGDACGGEVCVREGSSDPRIPMMESANAPKSDHLAGLFNGPRHGRVAAKGHVRAIVVVIGDMLADEPEQMPLSEHDQVIEQVIEQLSAQCAYPSFGETVLPRQARAIRSWRKPSRSTRASNMVPNTPSRSRIRRSTSGASGPSASTICLGRPRRVRVGRHVDVQDAPAFERQDEEDVEHAERHRRHGEKVDGDRADKMVSQERLPRL